MDENIEIPVNAKTPPTTPKTARVGTDECKKIEKEFGSWNNFCKYAIQLNTIKKMIMSVIGGMAVLLLLIGVLALYYWVTEDIDTFYGMLSIFGIILIGVAVVLVALLRVMMRCKQ